MIQLLFLLTPRKEFFVIYIYFFKTAIVRIGKKEHGKVVEENLVMRSHNSRTMCGDFMPNSFSYQYIFLNPFDEVVDLAGAWRRDRRAEDWELYCWSPELLREPLGHVEVLRRVY